ncbi:amino acid ABC transporter permease [Pimelobacter simplex]|uniref:amino acid ABC transporter permease n=1 Tax=Nocardioides simplex TaxID=2045 RepID=UPI001931894F
MTSAHTAEQRDSALPEEPPVLPLDPHRPLAVGRILGTLSAILVAGWLAYAVIVNPNIHWDVIVDHQFDDRVLHGLWVTIELTVLSMAIGVPIGVGVAVMQMSANPLLRSLAGAYTWFFRGTPVLVQLLFWFNLGLLFPRLELGVPFGGPKLFSVEASAVITPFVAGLLGLAINEGAYMAQIVRAGIMSVDHGQREAAESLGMSRRKVLTRIILPQAMRIIIPPTGNQFISMLKTTSLVSVIAGADLLTTVSRIYLGNFEVISMLVVASIWYLLLTTIASVGQHYIERHYSRGVHSPQRLSRRVRHNLTGNPAMGAHDA